MEQFLNHLEDVSPAFHCHKPGKTDAKFEHVVSVYHELGDPASPDELSSLREKLGDGCDDFVSLYSHYNGMLLYVSEKDAGVRIYSISEFDQRNAEWREWFEDLDDDDLWDFQKHGVAFGEIVASGNYFIWWQGKVYYSDHDGGDDEPYGNSLNEFLNGIAENPARFLYDVGCYTRYGTEQLIPGEYVAKIR